MPHSIDTAGRFAPGMVSDQYRSSATQATRLHLGSLFAIEGIGIDLWPVLNPVVKHPTIYGVRWLGTRWSPPPDRRASVWSAFTTRLLPQRRHDGRASMLAVDRTRNRCRFLVAGASWRLRMTP
jgi:hypothetical protein